MIHLKEGSSLQGGRYRIEKVLGQGGFGITYLGIQTGLNRKVAIKEFFMKEYCNREEETSHVSVPSVGSKELVKRFLQKFVKEAQTISEFSCPNIIRIYDVFEENGTAYYVMEYHGHGSLADLVKHRGKFNEAEAVGYIRQVAEALRYIHGRNINHLDVKPGNVLLDDDGRAVLIDFGMSKRYDADGEQTSTTPVGISHGYAPLEQYKKGGVGTFSPATDIYSLGATLYKLVTGITPPDASEVDEDGLPSYPNGISDGTKQAIRQAMNMKRKDRPQSVNAFLSLLDSSLETDDDERTVVDVATPVPKPVPQPRRWLVPFLVCVIAVLGIIGWHEISGNDDESLLTDSLSRVDTICPLYVSTSPVGATVYLDGKKVGNSPLDGKEVSRGNHTVKLVLDGYEPFSKQYTFGDTPIIINESLVAVPVLVPVLEEQSEPVKAATTGSINGHEWVDLGLSVKWATMNVGANNPGDYGDYFAWGEVRTKSVYWTDNNKTWEKTMGNISGNSQYDAARYHWGGSWRLPTKKELEELKDKCRWTWTEQDGHNGYRVVGPNGNSIFLPAAGYRKLDSTLFDGTDGSYMSGSPDESSTQLAYRLYFSDDSRRVDSTVRINGISVRPVSE